MFFLLPFLSDKPLTALTDQVYTRVVSVINDYTPPFDPSLAGKTLCFELQTGNNTASLSSIAHYPYVIQPALLSIRITRNGQLETIPPHQAAPANAHLRLNLAQLRQQLPQIIRQEVRLISCINMSGDGDLLQALSQRLDSLTTQLDWPSVLSKSLSNKGIPPLYADFLASHTEKGVYTLLDITQSFVSKQGNRLRQYILYEQAIAVAPEELDGDKQTLRHLRDDGERFAKRFEILQNKVAHLKKSLKSRDFSTPSSQTIQQ